jgi:hypothetical protein
MSSAARAACLASLAGLCIAIFLVFFGDGHSSPPARITTDTPAYCELLQERVHELTQTASDPARQEAADLADEGRRLCAGGEIRAGLLRLRHAVMLIQTGEASPQ